MCATQPFRALAHSAQPVLDWEVGQPLEVPIVCDQDRVERPAQSGEHHVDLGQDPAASSKFMVDLGINPGHRRFERPDADLPKERNEDAPIVLPPARPLKPRLHLAEDWDTGSQSMASPTQLEYAFADAGFVVDGGAEVVGIEEVSGHQGDSISRRTNSLARALASAKMTRIYSRSLGSY